jgi:hypothetical protein
MPCSFERPAGRHCLKYLKAIRVLVQNVSPISLVVRNPDHLFFCGHWLGKRSFDVRLKRIRIAKYAHSNHLPLQHPPQHPRVFRAP